MARKANGQGHTYKVGNSYRTVIRLGDHTITAMAPSAHRYSASNRSENTGVGASLEPPKVIGWVERAMATSLLRNVSRS